MLDRLSDHLTSIVVNNNTAYKADIEIYKFGFQTLLMNFLGIILVLTIGAAFSLPTEAIIFLIPFVIIRRHTGGYHAQSMLKCSVGTGIIITTVLMLYNNYQFSALECLLLTIACSIPIYLFAPIENEKNPLSKEQISKEKTKSLFLHFLFCCIGLVFQIQGIAIYNIIFWAVIAITALIIIPVIKERRVAR